MLSHAHSQSQYIEFRNKLSALTVGGGELTEKIPNLKP